ncbi:alpha-L-fucosidase [Paenibacillus sp. RC67]|uniref:alpha-L-fucosidase n=1 Tax=Paenibacillus sp. RC67 TaxID=3039392 RepID=UPI0024ACEEE3|nr:alpha-L-fucosidase [Paenibacillus sp. RC67]
METKKQVEWFKDAKWGVCCHYLPTPPNNQEGRHLTSEEWNDRVDCFDVEGLVSQLEAVGAGYFLMTIGQNTGHYCSPNATYDSIVGIHPSKCSRRDLISDLADALTDKGIKLLVYLPSGAPASDPVAMEKLEWEWGYEEDWGKPRKAPEASRLVVVTTEQGTRKAIQQRKLEQRRKGKRLAEFQRKWEAVITEWSQRWGSRVSGWWIDGCYFADEMYRHTDEPNFQSFAAALKSGNQDSIVAFNPGVVVPVESHTSFEDYTAGEISKVFPMRHSRWVDGAQYHTLGYLGSTWGDGSPRFPDELVIGYTKHVNRNEGVVTWDVPISHQGLIEEPFIRQLKALRQGLDI